MCPCISITFEIAKMIYSRSHRERLKCGLCVKSSGCRGGIFIRDASVSVGSKRKCDCLYTGVTTSHQPVSRPGHHTTVWLGVYTPPPPSQPIHILHSHQTATTLLQTFSGSLQLLQNTISPIRMHISTFITLSNCARERGRERNFIFSKLWWLVCCPERNCIKRGEIRAERM